MKLLVGLGNPGDQYARHRHNVGFMAVDAIAERYRFSPWRRRFQGAACEGEIAGTRVILLKPETYMNESGRSAGEALRFMKIAQADLIVFHDELDVESGRVKVKSGGGNAGHNGLKSISAHIGNDYARVRIGIGHPGHKDLVSGYVLHDFSRTEQEWLTPLLDKLAANAEKLLSGQHDAFAKAVAMADNAAGSSKVDTGSKLDVTGKPHHPIGERQSKRQSALADNLQRWLAGKPPKGS